MNRRKERVPCAHPSCYVLRATNTTGRALHPGNTNFRVASATSAAAIKRPFSLKCRDVLAGS